MENFKKPCGFIGTGFVGGSIAKDFKNRGYDIVQYSLDPQYINNKEKLKECRIIFVAVPTPTTSEKGFDDSILISAIKEATHPDQIIVIKSTIQIGTTDKIQELFSDRYIIHSPEFLTEKTAEHDAGNPDRNILGYTSHSKGVTGEVMRILPCAPYNVEIPCREAEMVKYAGNCWFVAKVLMMNIFYDIAEANKLDFDIIKEVLGADKRVGKTHLEVNHQGGRGYSGHCFPKDFEALRQMYEKISGGYYSGGEFLKSAVKYNNDLLHSTNKGLDIWEEIYGPVLYPSIFSYILLNEKDIIKK